MKISFKPLCSKLIRHSALKTTKFELTFLFTLTLLTIGYFAYKFHGVYISDNTFYDSDPDRTLNYVLGPEYAFSSIRPLLFVISIIPFLIGKLLSPYVAWTLFNMFCLGTSIILMMRSIKGRMLKIYLVCFVLINFSTLVWTFVPETFLLGITFYLISISVYQEGNSKKRVIISGLIASTLNIFLLIPWLITHLFFQKSDLRARIQQAITVVLIIGFLSVVGKFLQRFKPEYVPAEVSADPNYNSINVGFLTWLHSPFQSFFDNLTTFITAPWIPNYRYEIFVKASDSSKYSIFIILGAIILSFISFIGLTRKIPGEDSTRKFLIALELGTFILFMTYAFHPFLFSIFLLPSRTTGLIWFMQNAKFSRSLIIILLSGTSFLANWIVFKK